MFSIEKDQSFLRENSGLCNSANGNNKHCPSIEEMIAESRKQATQNIVISRILDGMPAEKIAEGYEVSLDYVKQLTHQLKMDIEEAKAKKHKETGSS